MSDAISPNDGSSGWQHYKTFPNVTLAVDGRDHFGPFVWVVSMPDELREHNGDEDCLSSTAANIPKETGIYRANIAIYTRPPFDEESECIDIRVLDCKPYHSTEDLDIRSVFDVQDILDQVYKWLGTNRHEDTSWKAAMQVSNDAADVSRSAISLAVKLKAKEDGQD